MSQSFGQLARRMRSRTVDLIGISLIAIMTLSFGRQLINWWRAPTETDVRNQVAEGPLWHWGADGQPLSMEFGDRPQVLTRQTVTGSFETARDTLAARLRSAIEQAPPVTSEIEPAERDFLKLAQTLRPFEELPGDWSLYTFKDQFSFMFGLRQQTAAVTASTTGPAEQRSSSGQEPRLACWGFVLGTEQSGWIVLAFHQAPATRTGSSAGSTQDTGPSREQTAAAVEFWPEGARRILSARDEVGNQVLSFTVARPASKLMQEFDDWGQQVQAKQIGEWIRTGEIAVTRMELPDGATVSLQLNQEPDGTSRGILFWDRPPTKREAGDILNSRQGASD